MPRATALAKLAFAVGLLAWIGRRVGWASVFTSLRALDRTEWALAALILLTSACITMIRWHVLMKAVGLPSTPWRAIRLGFLGLLFNNVLPGLTSGDVVKALAVCRDAPSQRPLAVLSIVVDRALGLAVLLVLAGCVLPFDWGRYGGAAFGLYALLVIAACAVWYVSRANETVWATAGERPGLRGVVARWIQAALAYRHHPRALRIAVGLSVISHLLTIAAVAILGDALAEGALERAASGSTPSAAEVTQLRQLADLPLLA